MWWIILLLVVLWMAGIIGHVGGLIHFLLLIALIVLVVKLLRGNV